MKKLVFIALLVLSFSFPSLAQVNPLFDCDDWGEDLAMGFFCKIHEDKVEEFLNSLPEGQREILEAPYPATYYCFVKLPSRNDIKRNAVIHINPHEQSAILGEMPDKTEMERLSFIRKPEGSLYNWVQIKWNGIMGYVARHTVWCNRTDELAK